MTGRLANAICVVSILCLTVAGCEEERAIVPVLSPRSNVDAGARLDSHDGGQGASTPAHDAATPYDDKADGSTPTSEPTQDGVGCDVRSTGAVHGMVPSGSETGLLLTELSFDGQTHDKCGALGMGNEVAYGPMLRRSDGAVFYLRHGYIYRYMSDELTQASDAGVVVAGGKSPFDNDMRLEVPGHKCPPSKDATVGPFGRYMFKPNGKLVYTCRADPEYPLYNEKHELIGNSSWIVAVDNEDRVLLYTGTPDSKSFHNVLFGGVRKPLKIVGDVDNCMTEWQFRAVRALSSGFMLVLNNHCGLQLWQSTDTQLRFVDYYMHAPKPGADLRAIRQHSELGPDYTFYFAKVVCPYDGLCARCQGTYCALKPGHKEQSPMVYEVYKAPDAVKDWQHDFLQTWWQH